MTAARARNWWRSGVGLALLLGSAASSLPAQENAWVLIEVKRTPIATGAEKAYYLHVKDTSSTDGNLSATFIIEWTFNPRTVTRQLGWARPPKKFKPGDAWQGTASGDTTKAQLWTRMGLSRENDGALSNAQGGPGGTILRLPAANDPAHPYLMIGVDATLIHTYAHEGGDRPGAAIPQDSAEIARGDPVEYRRVYTTAGTSKSTATVRYTYVYKWGATEGERAAATADTSGTISAPPDWKTVVGGGGLAAAAAALAALYWKRRRAKGDKSTTPPDGPVGHVLQLSNDRFTMQADDTVALTVTVWAVDHKGATSLASSAAITLASPAGIIASPVSGSGRLVTRLAATKDLAPGTHALAITAQAGGSTYNASVAITAGVNYAYALELTPAAINLQRDGRETVRARVRVTGPDPDQCARETQRLAPAIAFTLTGSAAGWFTTSDGVEGDGKAGYLTLTLPDNFATLKGPNTATFTASVNTPTGRLAQACVVSVTSSTGFELAMDQRLRLVGNDIAGSLVAVLRCREDNIEDADDLMAAAARRIAFTVAGPHAHWLREEDARPGTLRGELNGDETPGKEVHPLVEVPLADLSNQPPFQATITASVDIPRYGSFSGVTAVEIAPPEWFIEAEVIKQELLLDGKDAAEFRVRLIPQQQHKLSLYGGTEGNQLNALLDVRAIGANAEHAVLTEGSGDAGYRSFTLAFGPEVTELDTAYVDVEIGAALTGTNLRQRLRINVRGKPMLKVSTDRVLCRAEGDPLTVTAEVLYPGGEAWKIQAVLKDTDAVEASDPEPAGKIKVVLTPRALPDGAMRVQGTLEFTASSPTQDVDPVSIPVTVQDEGLVLLTNPVTVQPDPKAAKPGLVKLQVLRWSAEKKKFTLDRIAMQKGIAFGDFTPASYLRGENVFKGAGVAAEFQWLSGSGMDEYAVYRVRPRVPVPGDAAPIDAKWTLRTSSAGADDDKFEKELTVQFPSDPQLAVDPKLAKEIENCRRIVQFLPEARRDQWQQKILAKDAALLGYKGLYKMRHDIWDEARTLLMEEAEDYLEEAKYNDRVVFLLEWAQWINDLAWQACSTVAVPFPGNLALDQVRAFVTEYCAAACNEGTPLEAFTKEYFARLYHELPIFGADMAVGLVANLDHLVEVLQKKFPTEPVKAIVAACQIVWVIGFIQFLSYKKNPANGNPYSIPEAAWEATKLLRDQVLISVACRNWKAKHGEPGAPPAGQKPKEPTPQEPAPKEPPTKTTEKTPVEKTASEKTANEKGAAEKTAAEKTAAEKTVTEKTATEKTTSEKGKADKEGIPGKENESRGREDEPAPGKKEPDPDGVEQRPDAPEETTQRKQGEKKSSDDDDGTAPKDRDHPPREREKSAEPKPTDEPPTKTPEEGAPEGRPEGNPPRTDNAAPPKKRTAADNPKPDSVVHPDKPQAPEEHLDRFKEKPLSPNERENAWHEGKQQGQDAINKAHQAAESGDPQATRDAALGMQSNKQGLYEINRQKTPQSAKTRETLNNEIKQIYTETDAKVCAELSKTHGPGVRAKSITNEPKPGAPPKDPTKMPIDRDVTYERPAKPGEWIPDAKESGKFVKAKGGEWVDVPAKDSGKVYAEKFKETALKGASPATKAKYKDMPPEKFAKHMDQTVTDRVASDAYGRGPKDLETAVKNPAGEFADPAGVGKTAEFKGNEWFERAEKDARTPAEHETFVAEGMRQTSKQYGNQIENRLDVLNQNRGAGSSNPDVPKVTPPGELKAGIDIMKKVADGKMSPAKADTELAKIGQTREGVAKNLGEFLTKIYKLPVKP